MWLHSERLVENQPRFKDYYIIISFFIGTFFFYYLFIYFFSKLRCLKLSYIDKFISLQIDVLCFIFLLKSHFSNNKIYF